MSCHVWVPMETGDGQASHKDQYGEASREQTYYEDFVTTHMYGPADFLQQTCDGNFRAAQDPASVLQTSGNEVPGTNLEACKTCFTGSHTSLYQPQSFVLCGSFSMPCEAQPADYTGSPHEAYCERDTEYTAYVSPNGAKSQHCAQTGEAMRAQRTLRSPGERPSTQSAASPLPCGLLGSTATPEQWREPEGAGCGAFQSTMAGGKPIDGMMPRVTSLNVSISGEGAFDQLLGPELCGDSPQQVATPSSFLTNGPTVNPGLSGYSPRSMPIQLSIAPDANPAGSSDHGMPTVSLQQPSMATDSESLPVLPSHHMPQPTHSSSGQQGLPPSDLVSVLSAPEHQQDQLTQPATEGHIQAWREPRQKESHYVCSAPYSCPLPLNRSTPTYAEQALPLPAHSASPPSATSAEQHEDCPIPSSDIAGPGRCTGSGSDFNNSSLPMSSTLAASALEPSQVHMGGSSDGLTVAPLRQGQMKSPEEILQQGHSSHDAGALAGSQAPPITVHPVVASGQTVFATACMQPKSPIIQLHSAGGSVAESSTLYSNSGACPYPYSMPETYNMPYSMPYGDPYYSYTYPYHPSMDAPPPPHDPDALITYGAPHMGHQCLDSSTSRTLHYPGFIAPRQSLYRRFISGAHGRRTCQPADGMSHDGLMSMSSDPTNCASTSAAQLTGERPPPLAAVCGTRKCGAMTTLDYMSKELGSGATVCVEPDGITSYTYRSHMVPVPRPHSSMEADMDGVRVARACHEEFSADDVPLPLPPSTVDGIRQELRMVTQELLQRRMGEARRQQPTTGGGEHPSLQLTRSGASGDQAASLRQDHEPIANAVSQEAQIAPAAHADPYFQAGTVPGGHSFSILPHKRGAASDPSSSAGPSPVRSRLAPSAPVGHVGRSASHRGADLSGEMSNDPASQPLSSLPIPTTAVPCGSHHLTPSVSGLVMSRSALAGTCKHPAPAINMSLPAGPRPAMSGKSAASGTHGASVAQMPPACRRQQPQPQISTALLMGAHCVGQQGSMVAEAEDDGEEVHGPLQRCRNTRSRGVVSCGTRAACGPLPFPAGYYGTSVPLPSYDYSHGYYYPPPMTAYGMRMYGMTPSVASSAPPSYRLSSASAPTYGLPPPPPAMSTAPIPSYSGPGPAPWSDYCESQGGLPLAPEPAGAVPSGLVHGPAPA